MLQVSESKVAETLDEIRDENLGRTHLWVYRGAVSLALRIGLIDSTEHARRCKEFIRLLEDAQ